MLCSSLRFDSSDGILLREPSVVTFASADESAVDSCAAAPDPAVMGVIWKQSRRSAELIGSEEDAEDVVGIEVGCE